MFEVKSLYFNSAYLGPMPLRAKQKVEIALKQSMDPSFFEGWQDNPDRVRSLFARLLEVSPENVAFSTSVSELVSHVANGIDFKESDEILLMEGEYPSLVLPWMVLSERHGFKVRFIDLQCFLEPSRLREELSAHTKFVGASHVMFNTGMKLPIAQIGRICKEADVLFLADTSQSFGGMALTPEIIANVDILVGVGYKWLVGPYGSAYGYFSDAALAKVQRTHASWLNSPNAKTRENLLNYTTTCRPGARRFDRGQAPSFLICAALEGALEELLELNLAKIESHNRGLVSHFIENLPRGFEIYANGEHRSNIVCVKPGDKDAVRMRDDLARRNIDVSVREGNLRLSFHIFNTVPQVDQLLIAMGD